MCVFIFAGSIIIQKAPSMSFCLINFVNIYICVYPIREQYRVKVLIRSNDLDNKVFKGVLKWKTPSPCKRPFEHDYTPRIILLNK